MKLTTEPEHKFRKLFRFAQEVEGCRFKSGGKSKKRGFDEITLLLFLFQKAFKKTLPNNYDDILKMGVEVPAKTAKTGDLATFVSNSGDIIIGLILGQIDKEIVYSSKEKRSIVIDDFSQQIGNYELKNCYRLFNREK